jgi:hypothetical protein
MNTLVLWLTVGILSLLTLFIAIRYINQRADTCSVLETVDIGGGRRVQIVNDSCQEGLPHTTDARTIRMTRRVWESSRRAEVLRHEHVHCDQKGDLARWRRFYATAWGYECLKAAPASLPAEWLPQLRPNPDTADAPWAVWRNRWVFFPVAAGKTDDGQLRLRDARVLVWDLKTRTMMYEPPAEWRAEFCEGPDGSVCPTQYEHPHEMAAEFLTTRTSVAPAAAKLFAFVPN